jgi:hypothetical protein
MRYILIFLTIFLYSDTLEDIKLTLSDNSSSDKLLQVTSYLLGAEYKNSPLGEGFGIDSDPRFRLDQFDCTTFVETSMAMLRASNIDEVKNNLDKIRYKNKIGFQDRRHFPVIDWIFGLQKDGYIKDITGTFKQVKIITKSVNYDLWKRANISNLDSLKQSMVPNLTYNLEYIPLDDFLKISKNIPNGSIINIVREDRKDKFVLISHQALFFRIKSRFFLRHASNYGLQMVKDEKLTDFILRAKKIRKWKIIGVNINKIIY